MPHLEPEAARKRKVHTKSRRGCGNCKLRRVKCDEARPECQKCRDYGVSCNYDGMATEDLQLPGEGAFVMEIPPAAPQATNVSSHQSTAPPPQLPPTPPSEIILSMLGYPLKLHGTDEIYRLTEQDLDRFRFFSERTVFTLGTRETVHIYRDLITILGCTHDHLTHLQLAVVLMHQRYLSEHPYEPSEAESFHTYHGTALLRGMLERPSIAENEKDAVWGCAALLGVLTMGATNARNPAECWPLRPASPEDLDWLRMGEGKREIWKLTDPLREGSIWREPLQHSLSVKPAVAPTSRASQASCDALYPFITKLYDFDESANGEGDPYHAATSILVRLLPIEANHSTIMYFLSFFGHMDADFKALLHQKDPKAMLLLAWWFATLADYKAWWISRRGGLECKAICVYLSQRFTPDSEIGRLLDYPKMRCGMVVRTRNSIIDERAPP